MAINISPGPSTELKRGKKMINTMFGPSSGTTGMDKQNILSMFIHDLKNPTFVAKGFLTRLISDKTDSLTEKQTNYLNIVNDNLDKLNLLIKQILEVMRLKTKEFKPSLRPINMIQPVLESINYIKLAADLKGIKIYFYQEKNLHTTTFVVNADSFMIKRALTNILDNAVKYTNPEGIITVRLSNKDDDVLVQIKDNGVGIPEEHLCSVFEPFYRVRQNQNGSGLGLFFVKAIVENHNGGIWAESIVDKGTSISFTLPKYITEDCRNFDDIGVSLEVELKGKYKKGIFSA